MSTTRKKYVYPYRWGVNIVNAFVEKYARGTYYLAKCVGIAAGEVRHHLCVQLCKGNSVKFEAMKRVIKGLNAQDDGYFKRMSEKERKLLIKWLVYMAEDEELDALIARDALDNSNQTDLIL